jgi:hypothetical protein
VKYLYIRIFNRITFEFFICVLIQRDELWETRVLNWDCNFNGATSAGGPIIVDLINPKGPFRMKQIENLVYLVTDIQIISRSIDFTIYLFCLRRDSCNLKIEPPQIEASD